MDQYLELIPTAVLFIGIIVSTILNKPKSAEKLKKQLEKREEKLIKKGSKLSNKVDSITAAIDSIEKRKKE